MEKMMRAIMQELHEIEERGLSGGNLELAYRLIDMYKDLKNVEYWEAKMHKEREDMEGYSSRGRRRDSMGRYSRDGGYSYADGGTGGGYSNNDNYSYRSSYDGHSLDDCVDDMVERLEEMARDARSPEEREKIHAYVKKIKQMR